MSPPSVLLAEATVLEQLAHNVRYPANRRRLLSAATRLRKVASEAARTAPAEAVLL
jgi:hypothetical protein